MLWAVYEKKWTFRNQECVDSVTGRFAPLFPQYLNLQKPGQPGRALLFRFPDPQTIINTDFCSR